VLERTLQGVIEEARWYRQQGFLANSSITTIYLGGGTPSVIPPDTMNRFLGELLSILEPSLAPVLDEFCVEANPESLNAELLDVLAAHGVDRISLGIQSFQTDLLHLLGRRATKDITLKSLDLIKSYWPRELNTDFITGIPGQTLAQVHEDLSQVLQWNPDHVSLYSLMVEDKTPFKQLVDMPLPQGGLDLLPHGVYEDLWFAGRDMLESAGFVQYEVSNFAQPGKESAHNLGYWQLKPYLGLGPGAYSTLWTNAGPIRSINPTVFAYTPPSKPWNSFTRTIEMPTPREWLSELLLTAVRTDQGISKNRILKDLVFRPKPSVHLADNSEHSITPWDLIDLGIRRANAQSIQSTTSLDQSPWVQPKPDSWTLSREARYIQDRLLVDLELILDQLVDSVPLELNWAI
jgi:oxygen-independent coproporphyrinogen-3 oxidase